MMIRRQSSRPRRNSDPRAGESAEGDVGTGEPRPSLLGCPAFFRWCDLRYQPPNPSPRCCCPCWPWPILNFRPDPHKKDLVILYKDDDFKGGWRRLEGDTPSLVTVNMNDEASSFKVRIGYSVIFYEDTNYKGEWFPSTAPPIGIAQSEFCEIDSLGNDITTTSWCFLRSDDYRGCLHWWNDRVSSRSRSASRHE